MFFPCSCKAFACIGRTLPFYCHQIRFIILMFGRFFVALILHKYSADWQEHFFAFYICIWSDCLEEAIWVHFGEIQKINQLLFFSHSRKLIIFKQTSNRKCKFVWILEKSSVFRSRADFRRNSSSTYLLFHLFTYLSSLSATA